LRDLQGYSALTSPLIHIWSQYRVYGSIKEFLDKQRVGALSVVADPLLKRKERPWIELKHILTRYNCKRVADSYIGEWMYRTNILNRLPIASDWFNRFMYDIERVYPGIGCNPMTRNIENCQCSEWWNVE